MRLRSAREGNGCPQENPTPHVVFFKCIFFEMAAEQKTTILSQRDAYDIEFQLCCSHM